MIGYQVEFRRSWHIFEMFVPSSAAKHRRYGVTDPTRFQTTAADYNAGRDEVRRANPEQISLIVGAAVLVNH